MRLNHPLTMTGAGISLLTFLYALVLAISPVRYSFQMFYFREARFVDLPLSFDIALVVTTILNLPAVLLAWPIAEWIAG